MLYSKKTWISPESGIRSLPSKALSITVGAEAVLLHLFRVVLKKYSNCGVLMAVCVFANLEKYSLQQQYSLLSFPKRNV